MINTMRFPNQTGAWHLLINTKTASSVLCRFLRSQTWTCQWVGLLLDHVLVQIIIDTPVHFLNKLCSQTFRKKSLPTLIPRKHFYQFLGAPGRCIHKRRPIVTNGATKWKFEGLSPSPSYSFQWCTYVLWFGHKCH